MHSIVFMFAISSLCITMHSRGLIDSNESKSKLAHQNEMLNNKRKERLFFRFLPSNSSSSVFLVVLYRMSIESTFSSERTRAFADKNNYFNLVFYELIKKMYYVLFCWLCKLSGAKLKHTQFSTY